jgi:predicted HTH transcriptional regulator
MAAKKKLTKTKRQQKVKKAYRKMGRATKKRVKFVRLVPRPSARAVAARCKVSVRTASRDLKEVIGSRKVRQHKHKAARERRALRAKAKLFGKDVACTYGLGNFF